MLWNMNYTPNFPIELIYSLCLLYSTVMLNSAFMHALSALKLSSIGSLCYDLFVKDVGRNQGFVRDMLHLHLFILV